MGTRACGREAELGRGIRQEAACWACQGQEHGVAGGPRIARRGAENEDKNGLGARAKQLKSRKAGPDNERGAWETSARSTCGHKGHCEQDMRQERALNRIARNEDVTEWRRDSICSLSLDKRYAVVSCRDHGGVMPYHIR